MRGTGRISVMSRSAPLRHRRAAGPLHPTCRPRDPIAGPIGDAGHPNLAPALDDGAWEWSLGHTWGMCHRQPRLRRDRHG